MEPSDDMLSLRVDSGEIERVMPFPSSENSLACFPQRLMSEVQLIPNGWKVSIGLRFCNAVEGRT